MKKFSMPFLSSPISVTECEPQDTTKLQPKQETLDFLKKFAAAYHAEKQTDSNVCVDFILN